MIFSALRTQAASRFRDTANAVYTDTEWKEFINEAYQTGNRLSPYWPWNYTAEQTVSVLANSRATALAADVFAVNWAYDVTNDTALVEDNGKGAFWRNNMRSTTVSGPFNYRIRGNNIELSPLPNAATSLRIEAVLRPVELSADGDEPVWPETYHRLIVEGAVALAYMDDGNMEQYKARWERFQKGLSDMQGDLLSASTQRNQTIRDTFWDGEL